MSDGGRSNLLVNQLRGLFERDALEPLHKLHPGSSTAMTTDIRPVVVFVVKGEIFDVVVDIRPHSSTFGRWVGEILSDQNNRQIFVPEGFAHGFCVLSDTADVIYKCTDLYYPEDDRGINWADQKINIDWPVKNPVMSDKDKNLPMLHDVPKELLPQP